MDDLFHRKPNCIGGWIQEIRAPRVYWWCSGCGATCFDAPQVLDAVITECAMGVHLDRLTREGRRIIEDLPPKGEDR